MRKTKEQKAITLVALIITIVVLLILALVTINAVRGDGIIGKAQQAKEEYQKKSDEENSTLEGYLAFLEENAPGGSSSGGEEDNNGDNSQEGTEDTVIKPQIGDKVAYDEGSGKTSSIDTNFVMKDMEWIILDIEDDGTIELISTQQTDSTLRLSGQTGWLNAETKLDTLCNDLYANGEGVTARSLKVEDIDKLAGVETDEDKKALDSNYGSLWRYKYDTKEKKIQYAKSVDNGSTWTNYANTNCRTFKEPGKAEINGTNYQDEEGNQIINEQRYTWYRYGISSKVTQTTSDGISMADLISKGLNDTNDGVNDSYIAYWLSSKSMDCDEYNVYFEVRKVENGRLESQWLWDSGDDEESIIRRVRPVVTLPSSVTLTNVDGVWQVNI